MIERNVHTPGQTTALFERFKSHLQRNALLEAGDPVVVGVSGGVDSIVLLDLLRRVTKELHVVHVNYGFRGHASEADEALVRDVCERWEIPVDVHRATDAWRAACSGKSMQEAARELRYDLMHRTAVSVGSKTVAVGHHLDDQAETVLLRMFRGSGVHGLAGMRVRRPLRRHEEVELVRPLLFAERREIEAYALERNLSFRQDASNDDPRFERVRVRQAVIPAIKAAFGDSAVRNVSDAALRLAEAVDHGLAPLLEADLSRLATEHGSFTSLDLDGLFRLPAGRRRLLILHALRRYLPRVPHRTSVIERIESLMDADAGKHLRFPQGAIWRDRASLAFVPETITPPTTRLPIMVGRLNETPFGTLLVERVDPADVHVSTDAGTEVMDAGVLSEPLTVGPWLPGERFQPLGLSGTTKISDFLTDRKIPTFLRKSVPVVRSGDRVVWVAGVRLAHPFRLTDRTTAAVRMRIEMDVRRQNA